MFISCPKRFDFTYEQILFTLRWGCANSRSNDSRSTMHDSCINYSDMFKLCSENLNNIFYGTNDLIVTPRENAFHHDNTTNLAVLLRLINIG